jgi:hypothetical protein
MWLLWFAKQPVLMWQEIMSCQKTILNLPRAMTESPGLPAVSNALMYVSYIKVNGNRPCPNGFYGTTKREAEDALDQIAGGTGLDIVLLCLPLI